MPANSNNNNQEERVLMGYVGFVEVPGGYQSAYNYRKLNYITTDDSCYLSKVNNNLGNPLTDTTKWLCIANGKPATAAAAQALQAYNNCVAKIAEVNALIDDLNDASGVTAETRAALASINTKMAEVATTQQQLEALRSEIASAITAANEAYALVSQITGVDVFAQIPATLRVIYDRTVPLGSNPIIKHEMFPETANHNVFYLSRDTDVTPDGVVISPATAGDVNIYVIAKGQSHLWAQITITFRALTARTTEDGTARTAEDGTAIEC